MRCDAEVVLEINSVRKVTAKEYDEYDQDVNASIDLGLGGAKKPSLEELRRKRKVARFKLR